MVNVWGGLQVSWPLQKFSSHFEEEKNASTVIVNVRASLQESWPVHKMSKVTLNKTC